MRQLVSLLKGQSTFCLNSKLCKHYTSVPVSQVPRSSLLKHDEYWPTAEYVTELVKGVYTTQNGYWATPLIKSKTVGRQLIIITMFCDTAYMYSHPRIMEYLIGTKIVK